MNLRLQAELDLATTLEDNTSGFGWPIAVTDPTGFSNPETIYGMSNDIGLLIDPDTGTAISGRFASVTLRISTLVAAGFSSLPRAISDPASKPWLMSFDDINGNNHVFKVKSSMPDRGLGILSVTLEAYKTA